MRITSARLALLGAALVLLAPAAVRGQEGIYVQDFATNPSVGPSIYNVAGPAQLRQSTMSTVIITKNLIDMVPDQLISASGGTIVGGISHFRDTHGVGSISMKLQPVGLHGSTVTLNVGTSDHFTFNVTREGLISSVSFTPVPTTVPAGTPIVVTVAGSGLLGAQVKTDPCNTVQAGTSTNVSLSVTLKRSGSCTSPGPFQLHLVPTAGQDDPQTFAQSNAKADFSFGPYAPTVACTSAPGLVAPGIIAPTNGQTIKFTAGASATQAVTVSWQPALGPLPPNNQFVLQVQQNVPSSGKLAFTSFFGQTIAVDTLVALGKSLQLHVPGTYKVVVRPLNCGAQPQPTASTIFTLSF